MTADAGDLDGDGVPDGGLVGTCAPFFENGFSGGAGMAESSAASLPSDFAASFGVFSDFLPNIVASPHSVLFPPERF